MERNQIERLPFYAARTLREMAIDYGMQFAPDLRRRIERSIETLRTALERGEKQILDITQADLHQALYELNREAYLYEGNKDWSEDWSENQSEGSNDNWDRDIGW